MGAHLDIIFRQNKTKHKVAEKLGYQAAVSGGKNRVILRRQTPLVLGVLALVDWFLQLTNTMPPGQLPLDRVRVQVFGTVGGVLRWYGGCGQKKGSTSPVQGG